VADILREMCDLTDGATMSGKKDSLVNIGGWLGLRDELLAERARNLVVVYEGLHTYGGLAGRDMEAMAIGIEESVQEDQIRSRIGQVLYLGEQLIEAGIPIVRPIGGHAVFLDAAAMLPHIPREQLPAQALAAALYLESGIRAMERGTVSAGREPKLGACSLVSCGWTGVQIASDLTRGLSSAGVDMKCRSVGFVRQEGRMSRIMLVLLAITALTVTPATASPQTDTTRRRDTTRAPRPQDSTRRVQAEARGEIDLNRSVERFGVGRPNYGFTVEQALDLQQALTRAGCDVGTVDGVVGQRTLRGIECFRDQQNLGSADFESVLTALRVSFARPAEPAPEPAPPPPPPLPIVLRPDSNYRPDVRARRDSARRDSVRRDSVRRDSVRRDSTRRDTTGRRP
jgi:peptidoglycan hydrolase-like protein with peptidoglycan-binding domain